MTDEDEDGDEPDNCIPLFWYNDVSFALLPVDRKPSTSRTSPHNFFVAVFLMVQIKPPPELLLVKRESNRSVRSLIAFIR